MIDKDVINIVKADRNHDFTVIANDPLNDRELSFEAVGVLVYLLSKPDFWKVHLQQLASRGGIGRDKIQRIVRELISTGYIERKTVKDKITKAFIETRYIVFNCPNSASAEPQPEIQAMAIQDVEKATTVKAAHGKAAHGKHGRLVNTKREVRTERDIANGKSECKKVDDVETAFDLFISTANLKGLPVPKVLTTARRKALNTRLKECEGLDGWREALAMIEASAFLTGKATGDRPFTANLDFVLRQSSFMKIIEGNYLTEAEKQTLAKRQANSNPTAFDDKKWRNGILPVVLLHHQWQTAWGPAPGQANCHAPQDIIPQLQKALEAGKVAA